jgi:RimJ/RimL family protein N-acetyltransferase
MLDRQPVLEDERLLLRPLRAEDWDALFAVASDPLVWQQHPAHGFASANLGLTVTHARELPCSATFPIK